MQITSLLALAASFGAGFTAAAPTSATTTTAATSSGSAVTANIAVAKGTNIAIPSTIPDSVPNLLAALGVNQNGVKNKKAGKTSSGINVSATKTTAARHTHTITYPTGYTQGVYLDWKTFKGYGANIGGWLEKENNIDPIWWNSLNAAAPDEWTLCESLGSRCGPVFEKRYASFFTKADIDVLGSVGINVLRIPTTYAAWVKVPGSHFHHGNQKSYLREIALYAIEKYGMHIIIGLHSLPGGVNSLGGGEAFGHDNWFYNATNLYYSLKAAEKVLNFIENTGIPEAFTLAPLNEASDNFTGFATPTGMTKEGGEYVASYVQAVMNLFAVKNPKIPIQLQDCFLGEEYWSPFFDASANLVIDQHVYWFADAGIYSGYVAPAICGQGEVLPGDGKFPVFIGEFSLQTTYNNTLANRKTIYDTQVYAWNKYVSGGAMWTAKGYYGNQSVDGEGTLEDYWSVELNIKQGVITGNVLNSSYC